MITIVTTPPPNTIMDVDVLFAATLWEPNDVVLHFAKSIDGARSIATHTFVDMFGITLGIDCLSMGCKAAIAIYFNQDKYINCIEVGDNAINEILKYCHNAHLVFLDQSYFFETYGEYERTPISYNGYIFRDLDELNDYMREFYPDDPNDWGIDVYDCI